MNEPSNGEVMRRLDEVSRQLVQLASDMRDDRNSAADTYVRKDVFAEHRESALARVTALENENDARDKAQDAFRKQMTIAIICAAIPALLALLLALARLTGSGGA